MVGSFGTSQNHVAWMAGRIAKSKLNSLGGSDLYGRLCRDSPVFGADVDGQTFKVHIPLCYESAFGIAKTRHQIELEANLFCRRACLKHLSSSVSS